MQPSNNNDYELRVKIVEKLGKLQKRKIHPRNAAAKISNDKHKVMHNIKWNIIKRHLQQHQLQRKATQRIQVEPILHKDEFMDIITRIMILQQALIELAQNIAKYRRLQMGCIFFQCSLSIVFNAYNLVEFLLKIANETGNVKLSMAMLILFYGYHIVSSLLDTILSVMAYHNVYATIRQTATIVDELNIYISDEIIKSRLSQLSTFVYNNLRVSTLFGLYNVDGSLITSIISGTTTYIIILMQYGEGGANCASFNKTSTNTSN